MVVLYLQTQERLLEIIRDRNVEFIRLQFTDIQGIVKNVAIPVTQLGKAFKTGISFDGSSIEGFARIQESDMVLKPDLDTFCILPWRSMGGEAGCPAGGIQMLDEGSAERDRGAGAALQEFR